MRVIKPLVKRPAAFFISIFPLAQLQKIMSSDTSVTTATLRTLHRIHQQLADLQERLNRGPQLVRAHEANIALQEKNQSKLQDELTALQLASEKKQGQLRDSEAHIEKMSQQLNSATSNREFQVLKEQIAAAKMAASVLDDEILESWEKIEKLKEKVKKAETTVTLAKEKADKTQKEFSTEEPLIQNDMQRLKKELAEHENDLPANFQEPYRRVTQAHGQDAMAVVVDNHCSGCNQRTPLNLINSMMLAKPVFCKSCGRLTYLPE